MCHQEKVVRMVPTPINSHREDRSDLELMKSKRTAQKKVVRIVSSLDGILIMNKKLCVLYFSLLIIGLTFFSHSFCWAMDTDLYAVTGQEVPPNVLIILDNSSSMTTEDQPPDYNSDSAKPAAVV